MPNLASLQTSAYIEQMKKWAQRDAERLERMKNTGSGGPIFTNLGFPLQISFPLFEAKAPMSVPTKYYQALQIDGSPLRNDWAPDFCRSIAFLNDGLLLVSKAVARSGVDTLLFYHAVKFKGNEYSFTALGGGKFEVVVSNVKVKGMDLLRDAETVHNFDFTFKHSPTKGSKMSFASFKARSGVISNIYKRHGGMLRESKGHVIAVPHFAPHPYLLNEYARFGYKGKSEFQDDVSELLRSLLK
ncbi:hypothetical protein DRN67_04705 [Candidatus Micrarchaeota archaeon]|nr:MAG: hypothetical protein DRN67_04705 [Candidatus Micrarchaeota archaeon]